MSNYYRLNMKKILQVFALITLATSCKKESVKKPHFVGEIYGGGIIIDLTKDSKGEEHGLIVSTSDLSDSSLWSATGSNGWKLTNANSTTDGYLNCQTINRILAGYATACNTCLDYSTEEFNDWYLPATSELFKIYIQQDIVNKVLINDNDKNTNPIVPQRYWTSTELDGRDFSAYTANMLNGKIELRNKNYSYSRIRAVRRF